jgi:hypothetical protein
VGLLPLFPNVLVITAFCIVLRRLQGCKAALAATKGGVPLRGANTAPTNRQVAAQHGVIGGTAAQALPEPEVTKQPNLPQLLTCQATPLLMGNYGSKWLVLLEIGRFHVK